MPHNNLFDIIRLLSAIAVVISHHYALSGLPEPKLFRGLSVGHCAVLAFFSISGYLVTQSFDRSKSFFDFSKKRILRIFPGLIVCITLVVFFITPFFSTETPTNYLINILKTKDIIKILFFLEDRIPTVFDEAILKNHIFGSIWTLPYELWCYLILGVSLRIKNHKGTIMILLLSCLLIYNLYSPRPQIVVLRNIIPSYFGLFGTAFFFGALTAKITHKKLIFLLSVLVVSYIIASINLISNPIIFQYLYISSLVLLISLSFSERLIMGKFDYSYGIYIYSFPIQQVILNYTDLAFFPKLLLSLLVTISLAAFSWHYIEKPAKKLL